MMRKGALDRQAAFIDGSFAPAKKGGRCWACQKGQRNEVDGRVDGQGIPLGSPLASASPAEVTLAEETLETIIVPRTGRGRPKKRPIRLIADKGDDSDPPESGSKN
jgi:hypothetical protein